VSRLEKKSEALEQWKKDSKLPEHPITFPSNSPRQDARPKVDQVLVTYGFSLEHTESTEAQALSISKPGWSNNAFTAPSYP